MQVKCKGIEQDKKRYKKRTKVRLNGKIAIVDNKKENKRIKHKVK